MWNLAVGVSEEECPVSFSIAMMCYGMVALLFAMIIPYFFNLMVSVLKIEWPVLDPIIMFGWTSSGYLIMILISLGVVEFLFGMGRLMEE